MLEGADEKGAVASSSAEAGGGSRAGGSLQGIKSGGVEESRAATVAEDGRGGGGEDVRRNLVGWAPCLIKKLWQLKHQCPNLRAGSQSAETLMSI